MSNGETTVVCSCGRRLKTAGMTPGKRGRCPSCGDFVEVPARPVSAPASPPVEDDEWNWSGTYDLDAVKPPAPMTHAGSGTEIEPDWPPAPRDDAWPDELAGFAPPAPLLAPAPVVAPVESIDDEEWTWTGAGYGLGADAPAVSTGSGGVSKGTEARRAVGRRPRPPAEPWWPPRFLYPARAAEGAGMAVLLAAMFWVMGTLVPEYCLALIADGDKLGAMSMGRLIALISALPVLFSMPLALIYWLQYLARVLVVSGEGEPRPPRPPDRNFDGLFTGLSPWLLWLVIGAGVGFAPLAVYAASGLPWGLAAALGLGLIGLPYVLMAFLLSFLHDDPFAAKPGAVLGAIARLGPSFLGLCLTTAATLGLVVVAFAGVLALRPRVFGLYVVASLAGWLFATWVSIVAMRTLGSYYAARRGTLKWQRKRPRWGVAWRI